MGRGGCTEMNDRILRNKIASALRKRASLILQTNTEVGLDRYGDPVMAIKISAVKVGARCILIHHARNGDCLVIGNVPIDKLLESAMNAHREEYGDAEVSIGQ
jgi:hypothetical protein